MATSRHGRLAAKRLPPLSKHGTSVHAVRRQPPCARTSSNSGIDKGPAESVPARPLLLRRLVPARPTLFEA